MLSLALPCEARLRADWKETREGEPEREGDVIPECSIMLAVLLVEIVSFLLFLKKYLDYVFGI